MKRMISLMVLLLLFAAPAYGSSPGITMQEIVDANKTSQLLENYESIYFTVYEDGIPSIEYYWTDEFLFERTDSHMAFLSDCGYYIYENGVCRRVIIMTQQGLRTDAQLRKGMNDSVIIASDAVNEEIASVSEKDGLIFVSSFLPVQPLDSHADGEIARESRECEYLLDPETRAVLKGSIYERYTDGTSYEPVIECLYNLEMPEEIAPFLAYDQQTDQLRTFTFILHPGTEEERVEVLQTPKGLPISLNVNCKIYADASCTEELVPSGDYETDVTFYLQWDE